MFLKLAEAANAKDAWLKQVRHHRRRLKGLPRVGFNPNAGNVEYNISMMNKMLSPSTSVNINPINGGIMADGGISVGGIAESFDGNNLNSAIKDLLTKYADDIDNNNFDELYMDNNVGGQATESDLTEIFHSVGIEPLMHFTEWVPHNYASGSSYYIEVTIPETITNIGVYAFAFCALLDNVTILDGCEYIHENAFAHCVNLVEVTLPSTLREIEFGAFSECWQLNNVYYNGSVEDWYNHVKCKMPINKNSPFDRVHCLDGDAWV